MAQCSASKGRQFADGTLAASTVHWVVFIAMAVAGVCMAFKVSPPPRFDVWSVISILWFAVTGVYGFRIFRGTPSVAEPAERSTVPLKTQFVAKRQAILKILAADKGKVSQSRLQVRQVMTSHPSVVPPETSNRTLREIMDRNEHRHLLVCDKDRKLIGVVSDRDIKKKKGACVADIMTRDPFWVSPDSLVSPAVSQMLNRHISCLPVVEDDRVCGVVTTTDMMMTLQCMLQLIDQTADATANDPDAGNRAEPTEVEQMASALEPCEIGAESTI